MQKGGTFTKRLTRSLALQRRALASFTNRKSCRDGHGYALPTAQFAQHCDRSARNGYAMVPIIAQVRR